MVSFEVGGWRLLILLLFWGKVDLGENGTPVWGCHHFQVFFHGSWFKDVYVSIISIFLKSQVSSFQLS